MPESLGEKLREAREDRGISISEVAEQTRISALYLESIEKDDYRTLPGGIFNKGFVKSFAKYVGVDEQEALQDYARLSEAQGNAEDKNISKSYRPEVLTDDSSGPSMLPTIIFAIIILGLMTWGILALVNYLKDSQSQTGEDNIANNNVKTTNGTANSNVNTNGSTGGQTPVSLESIKVKMTSTAPELSITSTADGKRETRVLNSEVTEQTFEAEESLVLSYYKGLAETVQLTVNGKKIETPIPPPNYKKNGLELEINMANLKQIVESGKIDVGAPPIPANANANVRPVASNSNTTPNAPSNQNPAAANTTINANVNTGPPR